VNAFLCKLDDIPNRGSIGVAAGPEGRHGDLLAVRRSDKVFVYVNVCPHTGAPMDFTPGQFMSLDKGHIQCANHGAMFRINDGYCVSGPCAGESLEEVKTEVRDGAVYLKDWSE